MFLITLVDKLENINVHFCGTLCALKSHVMCFFLYKLYKACPGLFSNISLNCSIVHISNYLTTHVRT